MATNIFSLKTKDTNHYIYCNMIGQHIDDSFLDAYFVEAIPTNGDKAVCYKTVLGYTMRNAALYFDSKSESNAQIKINKVVIDLAICSKENYVSKPSYAFNSADKDNWNDSCVVVRKEKLGNRYTTYFRVTLTDGTPNDCTTCSIRFQTNGVFVYDAYVEYEGSDYITVSPTTANVPKDGSTETLTITSNVDWTATTDQNWCTVNPTSGSNDGTIDVSIAENNLKKLRTAHVKVKSPNVQDAVMTITQAAGDPRLKASPATIDIDYNSSEVPCGVESNITWYVNTDADWTKPFPTDGSNNGHVDVHIDKNYTTSTRNATLTFHNEGNSLIYTIDVSQGAYAGPALALSSTTIQANAGGAEKSIDVLSNKSWTVTKNEDWVGITPITGENDGHFTVSVGSNHEITPRSATITVNTAGNADTSTISVTQSGGPAVMTVTPDEFSFTCDASTNTFHIDSNVTAWTVTRDVEWCYITPVEGNHNGDIAVRVDANDTYNERTATITISSPDFTASKTVAITQDASVAPTEE